MELKIPKSSTKIDIQWIFTLFGTAVGAGLLYLPIQAGQSGFWAVLTVLIFALPLTYLSHRNMSNIVINSDSGIADVFTNDLGKFFGLICVVLYFFAIFLNMPMYSIGLNNELGNILLKYNITSYNISTNIWFSFSFLFILLTIVSFGINVILKFMQVVVAILILLVVVLSIYIIQFWNGIYVLESVFNLKDYIIGVLMVLPILILSMNFSPVVSSLVVFYKTNFSKTHNQEQSHIHSIIKINSSVLFIFVLLFITSCLLATTPEQITIASSDNLSIVTLLQQNHKSLVLDILAPTIVFTAIISSFIGCYIGSKEALKYLLKYSIKNIYNKDASDSLLDKICIVLIFIILWICTICNFKILNIIGILVAPTVAFLLYILPTIVIYKNIKYNEYRKSILNLILVIVGLTVIFGYIIGLLFN